MVKELPLLHTLLQTAKQSEAAKWKDFCPKCKAKEINNT